MAVGVCGSGSVSRMGVFGGRLFENIFSQSPAFLTVLSAMPFILASFNVSLTLSHGVQRGY